ncbi:hypothetical protein [Streptomyces silvensis]|uniref:Uncharacterized protein n=1 Tax=Streptomyces silvensis TaxID=1765722 RepID=A0A0W7X9G6_9ACTN|nr:hypothetical protein [Streptomyces silvensis]KUF19469.1 hypothetical protein AT728_03520 [Streptomyces silvensis]
MPEAAHGGQGRVAVFSLFGPAFGYASKLVENQQIAYIGPVTRGVPWQTLWQMADRCCRLSAQDIEKARWIVTQATRAVIVGADLVVKMPDEKWQLQGGGRRAGLASWAHHDVLITGDMAVPALTSAQLSVKHTRYPQHCTGTMRR